MPPVARLFVVVHVACRYRLFSLLPRHPARPLLLFFQYLMPASWLGTGSLSEGDRLRLALERLASKRYRQSVRMDMLRVILGAAQE